jgi:hypothetical protein
MLCCQPTQVRGFGLFKRTLGALTNQAWAYGDPNFRGLGDAGDSYDYGVNVDQAVANDYASTSGGGIVGGPSYSGSTGGANDPYLSSLGSSPVPSGPTQTVNQPQSSGWSSFLGGVGQGSSQGVIQLLAGTPFGQFFKPPSTSQSSIPWGTIALAGAGVVVALALLKRKRSAPSAG